MMRMISLSPCVKGAPDKVRAWECDRCGARVLDHDGLQVDRCDLCEGGQWPLSARYLAAMDTLESYHTSKETLVEGAKIGFPSIGSVSLSYHGRLKLMSASFDLDGVSIEADREHIDVWPFDHGKGDAFAAVLDGRHMYDAQSLAWELVYRVLHDLGERRHASH